MLERWDTEGASNNVTQQAMIDNLKWLVKYGITTYKHYGFMQLLLLIMLKPHLLEIKYIMNLYLIILSIVSLY